VQRDSWADLPDGPPEIENSPIGLTDQDPALLANVVQEGLLGFSHRLGTFATGQMGTGDFIFPPRGTWRSATTGQKQGAGREYDCNAFSHNLIL
jgi:hypothetical protein